ncbi:MAG: hypothetical protein IAF94_22600 [Pirellulaceae bacterium]|nr:hypothetical protein [Pirellulaceae bacterium]
MAVRCSKCGEELLGAVNRCWKCGHAFALRPEIDGRPPVRTDWPVSAEEPLDAQVIEQSTSDASLPAERAIQPVVFAAPQSPFLSPLAVPHRVSPRRPQTGELIDARRAGLMAMGGTVGSLVLGLFAAVLAMIWPPAALIAVLGLALGIWGLGSPRRNLALVGMLLCCLAIGLGAYGGARAIYVHRQGNRAISVEP